MCIKPITIRYSEKYKRFRGTLIHPYNQGQILPCGKCHECAQLKVEEWQIRWEEQLKTSLPNSSYMLTLTYDDNHLPTLITPDGEEKSTLNFDDLTKFFKRLRKKQSKIENAPKISYHACGEYGTRFTKRPHYHVLITNLILSPEEIEPIWKNGKVHVGDNVTSNTIKYVLKYTLKNSFQNRECKVKVYQEDIKTVKSQSWQTNIPDKLLLKLNWEKHVPTFEIECLVAKKLMFTYYQKGHLNEYRICEKTVCSKGIGKDYLTDKKIQEYRNKPHLNYVLHDLKKDTFKEKPLPRYYKEIIFNPKKRDENGKLIKDDYGRYVSIWSPDTENYEETPRYKRQFINYKRQQQRILSDIQLLNMKGLDNYIIDTIACRLQSYEMFSNNQKKRQNEQEYKNLISNALLI